MATSQVNVHKSKVPLKLKMPTLLFFRCFRLIRAKLTGPPLILDCSYDDHMTPLEIKSAARQLQICFSKNREQMRPFDLHFCGMKPESPTKKQLELFIPTINKSSFPINIHEECFMDLFPIERLVYLTPHCKNDLMDFDPSDIFIIGTFVDKGASAPLSLTKAKKLGLRMAKLPLDRFLRWTPGQRKCLQLHHVLAIMQEFRMTRDWQAALAPIQTWRRQFAEKK